MPRLPSCGRQATLAALASGPARPRRLATATVAKAESSPSAPLSQSKGSSSSSGNNSSGLGVTPAAAADDGLASSLKGLSLTHRRVAPQLAAAAASLPITRAATLRLVQFPQPGLPQPVPPPAVIAAAAAARRRPGLARGFGRAHPHASAPAPAAGLLGPVAVAAAVAKPAWTSGARRVGALAVKRGMTAIWDEWGQLTPCTVLQMRDCEVVYTRWSYSAGKYYVQVGAGSVGRRLHLVRKPQVGHFRRFTVAPKRKLVEFPVSNDAVLPSGTKISVAHFVPGQYIDCQGTSRGKGFQGVMKRWGFGGLGASHGVSISHRSLGSTGQRNSPGKVFKGKKMAGRMGGKTRTVHSLKVMKVDTVHGLLYVKGAVPGPQDRYVRIRDAVRRLWHDQCFPAGQDVPYPTHFGLLKDMPRELLPPPPPPGSKDPLARPRREVEK